MAVSGGVDSMVLLDVLQAMPDMDLVVAHYDHGIRADSVVDRQLVEQTAKGYGLPFFTESGNLGQGASEATARKARYDFLHRVKTRVQAQAIITAHHQDDLVETAIINLLRGTGRKGLSSMQSGDEVIRPLLKVPKAELYDYARKHPKITWHTDSTNASDAYLRNYIRNHLLQGLDGNQRRLLLAYIEKANQTNPVIDSLLLHDIAAHSKEGALNRSWFIMQPYDVSREIMAAWLRAHDIREFDKRTIERLAVQAKVAFPGKKVDINAGYWLEVAKTSLRITGELSRKNT